MNYIDLIFEKLYNFYKRLKYNIKHYPDLFPEEIKNGYRLFGLIPKSKKQSLAIRRIKIERRD